MLDNIFEIRYHIITVMDLDKAYRLRFALRQPVKGVKFAETGVPWLVIEREAKIKGMTVEEFLAKYEAECLFDDFDGLIYRFVPKEVTKKDAKGQESKRMARKGSKER